MCRVGVNVDKDFGWDVTAMSHSRWFNGYRTATAAAMLSEQLDDCESETKMRSCRSCYVKRTTTEPRDVTDCRNLYENW